MSFKKIVSMILILIMVIPASVGVYAEEIERQITIFSDTFEDTKAADWKSEKGSWQVQEALGKVLMEDNFDDGDASDWNGYKGTWNPQLIQGENQYSGTDLNATAISTKGELTWTNYVMEEKVTMLSDISTGGPVLIFRYVDNINYYRIHINKSNIELIRTKNGVQKWLTVKKYSSLKQNVAFNTKIAVVGNNIEFYIDDNKILSYNDTDPSAIPAGKIGLGTYKSTTAFDNVRVTEKLPVGKWFSQLSSEGGTATTGYAEWTDYSMKSSVYMSITGAYTGINLRYRDEDNKYSMVGDGSTIKIEKTYNGVKTILAQKAYALEAGKQYSFEGRITGQSMEFLIDENSQLTVQDDGLVSGKVGLTAGNDGVSFDNIEIKRKYTPYESIVSEGNTHYYVSSSDGNDSNNGLTPQTPWKSLLKVSSVIFAPGDTIHLKAGDIWDEMYDADPAKPGTESYGVMLRGSGTKDNPITLTRYGDGKRPIIRSAARALVYGKNVSSWTVQDLELFITTNGFLTDWSKLGMGMNFRVESDKAPISDIVIDNNEIYGIDYNHCSRGIVLSTTCYTPTTDVQARRVTISNNNIHDVGWVGISSAAWDSQKGKEYFYQELFENVLITMNDIYNTANNGILMSGIYNSEISRNVVDHGGQYKGNDLTWTPGGIWPISSKNVVMKFNEASFMSDSGTGWDGTGLNIDWNNSNVTMIYNYTHDNVGPGITTMAVNDCKIMYNKVERNASRIDELGQIMVGDFSGRPDLMTGVKNTEVSNNTVIHGLANKPAIQYRHVTEGDSWFGNSILNNNVVMVGNAKTGMTVELKQGTVADAVYRNRYYLENGIDFVADKYGVKYSFEDWQNILGYDTGDITAALDLGRPSNVTGVSAVRLNDKITLQWDASVDANSGISHYNIYRGTTPDFATTYRNMVGEAQYITFIDTEAVDPGKNYYYKIEAEDYCGNVSETPVVLFVGADVYLPQIETVDSRWSNAAGVPVNIKESTGINRIQYSLQGATVTDWTYYEGAFQVTNEGQTRICARTVDRYNSVSNAVYASVYIDRTASTAPVIIADTNWTNAASVPVSVTAGTDEASGVSRVEYSLSGATTAEWTTYTAGFDITNEGQTIISARTVDNAGNISAIVEKTVKINRTSGSVPVSTTGPTALPIPVPVVNGGNIELPKPKPDSGGMALSEVPQASLESAIKAVKNGEDKIVKISVPKAENTTSVKVKLPAQTLNMAETAGVERISIRTEFATIQIEPGAFGDKIKPTSSNVELSVSVVDKSNLPLAIGANSIVFDFNAYIDGEKVHRFEGREAVKISIDYKIEAGENPEKVVAYYINDNGKLEAVKNCRYDASTGKVIFTVSHFSKYFAKESEVSFSDVENGDWAKTYIEALAGRGIVKGIGDNRFNPDGIITREEFVKMIVEAFEFMDEKATTDFKDVKEGTWYYNSIASAKKLEILNGYDDGTFGVGKEITRQEMAAIAYRAAKIAQVNLGMGNMVSDFSDSQNITEYAKEAITAMREAGIIQGKGSNKFEPLGNATRAETAKIIYSLLKCRK